MHLLLFACTSLKNSDKLFNVLCFLLEHGLETVGEIDREGQSALMHICMGSSPDKVKATKLLIDAGTDLNIVDGSGRDALYFAIKSDSKELIKLLLDNGCNVDSIVLLNYSVDTWNGCPDLRMKNECNPDTYNYVVKLLRSEDGEEPEQSGDLIDWNLAYLIEFNCYQESPLGGEYDGCDTIPARYGKYCNLPTINLDDWYLHKEWNGKHVDIYHWKTNINPTDNAILIFTDWDSGKLTLQVGDQIVIGGCLGGSPLVYTSDIAWGSSHGYSSFNCGIDPCSAIERLQEYLSSHISNENSDDESDDGTSEKTDGKSSDKRSENSEGNVSDNESSNETSENSEGGSVNYYRF